MVIKITPNNAFPTRSCTIKSLKSLGGRLGIEFLILLSCQRTLLPELLKAGAVKKQTNKQLFFFLTKSAP